MAAEIMEILGLQAEDKKQIGAAICMEILGETFQMQDKFSKAHFIRTQGVETAEKVREMLEEQGVLTKRLEVKKE